MGQQCGADVKHLQNKELLPAGEQIWLQETTGLPPSRAQPGQSCSFLVSACVSEAHGGGGEGEGGRGW